MPRLLFLAHRIPYPPVKGEKIRAWHMLERLARRFTMDLGFLVDDGADLAHLPFLRAQFGEVQAARIPSRRAAAARALLRARPGRPLSLGWFHDPALAGWVREGLAARRWAGAFVYSSAAAPYVMGPAAAAALPRRVLDLVDVDSAKWSAYAEDARFPMREVWRREARTLLAFERRAVREFDASLLVSPDEVRHFEALAPDCAGRVTPVENGVELGRFDPATPCEDPFGGVPALVFTGTMDYRPNVEAVAWFAAEVMPRLPPPVTFWIVGANPAPAVRALASERVRVTGSVPDVRPYLAHAAAAVAPLRIARGIQNKVLEAMAMARPVVATPQAFEGVRALAGQDLLVEATAEGMAARIGEILAGGHAGMGAAARAAVRAAHDWEATLAPLDTLFPG
ncbi:MAG: TIGR03087 family PEP-CTERM/XrtA system glycosyltransferase [Rubritepida sp.]|jgi:sugar transferase (PEP-CTERM/EpsH1 system associated)|nr:TIGR03087 family PEP-CTERM/XrtA system glycosyltransferase [Rubritepida sp.]